MTSRDDNDAQSASSVETGRATEQGEQHDPNAQDSKTMQVIQVQSLQTPPGHDPFPFSTCVQTTTAPLQIYAFSACGKT